MCKKRKITALAIVAISLFGCKKEEPAPIIENTIVEVNAERKTLRGDYRVVDDIITNEQRTITSFEYDLEFSGHLFTESVNSNTGFTGSYIYFNDSIHLFYLNNVRRYEVTYQNDTMVWRGKYTGSIIENAQVTKKIVKQ